MLHSWSHVPTNSAVSSCLLALLLIFIASQIFWIGQILYLAERFIPDKHRRAWFAILTGSLYLFVFPYSFPDWGLGHIIRATDYRPQSMLIYATFWWWFVGSQLAFLPVIAFGAAERAVRAAVWIYSKARMALHRRSPTTLFHQNRLSATQSFLRPMRHIIKTFNIQPPSVPCGRSR